MRRHARCLLILLLVFSTQGRSPDDATPTIFYLAARGNLPGLRALLPSISSPVDARAVEDHDADGHGRPALDGHGRAALGGLNARDSPNGRTAIHLAALHGHTAAVRLLHEAGAYVQTANKDGLTPMHAAAINGHVHTVSLLVLIGADVDATDSIGCTPLFMAAQLGRGAVVKTLILSGASIDKADKFGCNPLCAADKFGHTDVVALLSEKATDRKKETEEEEEEERDTGDMRTRHDGCTPAGRRRERGDGDGGEHTCRRRYASLRDAFVSAVVEESEAAAEAQIETWAAFAGLALDRYTASTGMDHQPSQVSTVYSMRDVEHVHTAEKAWLVDHERDIPLYLDRLDRACAEPVDSSSGWFDSCFGFLQSLVRDPRCSTRLDSRHCGGESRFGNTTLRDWFAPPTPTNTATGSELNIVILGAGPVGLQLAGALASLGTHEDSSRELPRVRVALFENRLYKRENRLYKRGKRPYTRDWITELPLDHFESVADPRVARILQTLHRQRHMLLLLGGGTSDSTAGASRSPSSSLPSSSPSTASSAAAASATTNPQVSLPINMIETLLLLSARDRGVRLYFDDFFAPKDGVNHWESLRGVPNLVIVDATGHHLGTLLKPNVLPSGSLEGDHGKVGRRGKLHFPLATLHASAPPQPFVMHFLKVSHIPSSVWPAIIKLRGRPKAAPDTRRHFTYTFATHYRPDIAELLQAHHTEVNMNLLLCNLSPIQATAMAQHLDNACTEKSRGIGGDRRVDEEDGEIPFAAVLEHVVADPSFHEHGLHRFLAAIAACPNEVERNRVRLSMFTINPYLYSDPIVDDFSSFRKDIGTALASLSSPLTAPPSPSHSSASSSPNDDSAAATVLRMGDSLMSGDVNAGTGLRTHLHIIRSVIATVAAHLHETNAD